MAATPAPVRHQSHVGSEGVNTSCRELTTTRELISVQRADRTMWWVIVVIVFTAGTSEGRKRNVIGKFRFCLALDKTRTHRDELEERFCVHDNINFLDTCVILGDNVTDDIMESFRLANEAVLDKLSPPLRLGINKTDIYREGRGFSYDNTSRGILVSAPLPFGFRSY